MPHCSEGVAAIRGGMSASSLFDQESDSLTSRFPAYITAAVEANREFQESFTNHLGRERADPVNRAVDAVENGAGAHKSCGHLALQAVMHRTRDVSLEAFPVKRGHYFPLFGLGLQTWCSS